jgi:hypothetical protein
MNQHDRELPSFSFCLPYILYWVLQKLVPHPPNPGGTDKKKSCSLQPKRKR